MQFKVNVNTAPPEVLLSMPEVEEWMLDQGVTNINNVNDCLKAARPWFEFYGATSPDDLAA